MIYIVDSIYNCLAFGIDGKLTKLKFIFLSLLANCIIMKLSSSNKWDILILCRYNYQFKYVCACCVVSSFYLFILPRITHGKETLADWKVSIGS